MPQKKGHTGNPNGRPKGSPNRTTATAREWLAGLLDKNRKQIERDIKALDPKDRLLILEKLMSYTVPKVSGLQISMDQLTEEQMNIVVNELLKKMEEPENDYQNRN